ncbi:hypothetical protein GCM10022225_84930 [Plantactinospora mayteni]|uniref:Uncharacterized protein n=1 Tax=Plantactinospora mayteni TaxID=566021 RepID=A0ABQ4F4V5_9ACTN|nr:hypothetical protein Pma05_84870 [Plantactinospora mayteni]
MAVFGTVAVGLAAALVYRAADVLDRDVSPSPARPVPPGLAPLQPPISYRWAALGALAAVPVSTMILLASSYSANASYLRADPFTQPATEPRSGTGRSRTARSTPRSASLSTAVPFRRHNIYNQRSDDEQGRF